jgi:hypothetical protein
MIKAQWFVNSRRMSSTPISPMRPRLCEVRFTTVKADIDLSQVTVSSANGDFNATSLAHVINTPTVNSLVLHTWLDKAGLFASHASSVYHG